MSKLINLFEEAKEGDIVLYPQCEIRQNYDCMNDLNYEISYQRKGLSMIEWEICSVKKDTKKVVISPCKLSYYFDSLNGNGIKRIIQGIMDDKNMPISVQIGDYVSKKYMIIFDKDYAENIVVCEKDMLLNSFRPMLVLKSDIMAAENGMTNDEKRVWHIFPTQITHLEAVRKCVARSSSYYSNMVKKKKIKSILEALINNVDKDSIKEYIALLKKNNPEILSEIIELAQNGNSKKIVQIFNALL